MRWLSCIILLFSSIAFSAEPPGNPTLDNPSLGLSEADISLTAEGLPSSFVNHVNALFGNLLIPTVDFVVPGPTPLPLIRYYNSDSTLSKWIHGMGMSSNYPLWIRGVARSGQTLEHTLTKGLLFEKGSSHKSQNEEDYIDAYAEEDGGSILYFSAKPHTKEMKFFIDPKTIHKGLTNVGSGEISARTNLKNMSFYSHMKFDGFELYNPEHYDAEWTVGLSNGGERHYSKGKNLLKEKIICREIKPNGNKLLFTCGSSKNWGTPLQKIIASSYTNKHFGWLEVEYSKHENKVDVHTSNGKFASYIFEHHSSKKFPHAPYITKVFSSDHPTIHYEYTHFKDRRLISKIIYPEGRFLSIKYDDEGRVKEQRAPVGHNNSDAHLYRFSYHPHTFHTTVYDANDNKTFYRYSSKKRLKSLERCDQNDHSLREDKFFWGDREEVLKGEHDKSDEGNLLGHVVQGPEGVISCTRYEYDDYGNIIEEKFYGNLTGREKSYLSIDSDGKPKKDPEKYRKYAKYNNDKFHLCTKKSEDDGPTYTFQYKQNTDLLSARFTQDGDDIKIREFFEYDDCAVLTKKIVDDGSSHDPDKLSNVTERHITYITPVRGKEDHGVGQPEKISEFYLDTDTGKEKLLKKTEYRYYKDGKVARETIDDKNSEYCYHISYSYDKHGNITEKVHADDKKYVYAYDENNNKIREELLESGFHNEFKYDAANRLTQEIEVHHNGPTFTTTYTYDHASNRTSVTDKFGQTTRYEYDALGRATKITYPAMVDRAGKSLTPSETVFYDPLNKPSSITDANGNKTFFQYTARGQPTLISYPDGSTEQFVYNKNGTLAQNVDRHGVETAYEYDFTGRVTKTTVAGEKVTTHTYSSFHETSFTDPMVNRTEYAYDGAGRLCEKKSGTERTTYKYDKLGRKSSTRDFLEDGSYVENNITYDLFNRVTEETTRHSDGTLLSQKNFSYDILDNCTETRTHASADVVHTDCTTYNSQRLPASHTDALGHTTRYEYEYAYKNVLNQSVFRKKTIDPLGIETIEEHDSYHRIDTIEKRSQSNALLAKTLFRYDAKGNKLLEIEYVYSEGALLREYVIERTYFPTDLVETITEQPGTSDEKKTVSSYVKGGLLETVTKPDGVCIKHAYDRFSRLASIGSSDGSIRYAYSYDLNDNVLSVCDEVHSLMHTKSYDRYNRVVKDSIGTGVESAFTYDALNRITGFSLSSGDKVSYTYGSGQLRSITRSDPSNNELYTHRYEAFDLCGHVVRSSSIASCGTIEYDWDVLERLEKVSSQYFEEHCSKFDDAGNLLEVTQVDPQGSVTCAYTYDDLYQLSGEKGIQDASYINDSLCNRLQRNGLSYTLNGLNQLFSDGETSYTYDRNGNPTQIGAMSLSYDALDRLISVEHPGVSRSEYTYDDMNRRILKKNLLWKEGSWLEGECLRFIFFKSCEIGSIDTLGGQLKEFRVLGLGRGAELGASIAVEIEGKIFAPIHDHRYNIALLIDVDSKRPTDSYRYSAFGEEINFGNTKNPWRFASKRIDEESHLVVFGRRYYAPNIGRFLTQDPLGIGGAGPNPYVYVKNNPLMYVDIFGYIDEPSSGGGFFSSFCDRISDWWSGITSSSGGSGGDSSAVSSEPRVLVLNDGTQIVDGRYYPDQVLMYPDGNKGFLENYRGSDLGASVKPYVNGMCTKLYEACANAQTILTEFKGDVKHVMIGYNAGDGLAVDFGHALAGAAGLPPASSLLLAENIATFLRECENEHISFKGTPVCHSEGTVIWTNIRSMLEADGVSGNFIKINEAVYFGGPVLAGGDVTNYVGLWDPISLIALNAALFQEDPYFDKIVHNVHVVGPKSPPLCDPFRDHHFSGPAYTSALRQESTRQG